MVRAWYKKRPGKTMRRIWAAAAAGLSLPILALAQSDVPQAPAPDAGAPPVVRLPDVNVVGAAPLLGSGIPRGKSVSGVTSVGAQDVVRSGIPNALGALNDNVAGVTLNETSGTPFQPDLVFRGFTASPNDGSDEGLAVYVDGARFNQPFGDTVLWDLIPSVAIDRMNVEGANPVFGLNALGGSLNVKLKNGFTYHGGEITLYGGSYGRMAAQVQYGKQAGNTAAYIATNVLHDNGWRQDSAADLRQLYADLGWRGDAGEAHFSILGARNDIGGPGTTPVQLLAIDRGAQFTGPNEVHNKYLQLNLNGSYDVTDDTSLQGLLYYTNLSQRIVNGNTPNFQPCSAGNGLLCEQDGATLLTDRSGAPIPDYLNGGPYSELDLTALDSNGFGASVQATNDTDRFGHTNKLIAGVSFDGGVSTFDAVSQAGGLDGNRNFTGPSVVIDQSDGSIAPVRVVATNLYYGAYASDVFDLTEKLSLTLSGRFNLAQVDLADQNGTSLNGNHQYTRFNPGAGLTYRIAKSVTLYGSYAESNRAPTPAELSCASITSPCTLANFFVGDPNLKQVVARTVEIGARGTAAPFSGATLDWDLDLYRTETTDDLIFSPSTIPGRDFFQNIGQTQRQGIEASLRLHNGAVTYSLGYSLTDATFQVPITLDSSLNPGADANGQIHVKPGDVLPGIPTHRLKLGVDWQVTPAWAVGARGILSSGEYLFGDEANLTPTTGSYFVLNANTSYRLTDHLEIFALAQNLLNARYATYGTFSDPTAVPIAGLTNPTNTRALSPAAPFEAYGGVRITF
jgi:iron complex outermembrane recepter protein